MKFYPVINNLDEKLLQEEYRSARGIGVVSIGATCLFFRRGLKTWYIPYSDITRFYKRIELVPAKMCCGKGEFEDASLVIRTGEKELEAIALPDNRAAKILMEVLKEKMPGTPSVCPPKTEEAFAG